MNHGLPDHVVSAVQLVLAAFPEVEQALLYGSRAKGTFKRGSDVDLTLCGRELNQRLLGKIDAALDHLLLPYKIDLSLFADLRHEPLIEHIRRVGAPIYVRTAVAAL